jgi:hypothetical protein
MTNLTQPRPQPRLSERLSHARAADESSTDHEPTEAAKEVARGRSPGTPFVLLGSVAFAVWTAAALVAFAAVLIWWLV